MATVKVIHKYVKLQGQGRYVKNRGTHGKVFSKLYQ